MVEAILIGVIVISIFGLWQELKIAGSWNPHKINQRIGQRLLRNKMVKMKKLK